MKITSIKFIKGIVGTDTLLEGSIPQVAFVGRSNCGKSSLINSLTNSKIARTSSFPGRTQEINIFLVNESFYLVDLPGYGFTRISGLGREKIGELIELYFFNSPYKQKKLFLLLMPISVLQRQIFQCLKSLKIIIKILLLLLIK